ncbi:DUF4352 domain-containing protein [Exiguobacterium sp. s133]|uniref:DUF4352 domain-containing protein n=1 Tax=Exiguobacterium sp. s133 TaxID=2751213 RepID=UPI001BE95599|nr:DUF4352 domain-containing protein [Exiguobacterium sp. s133]
MKRLLLSITLGTILAGCSDSSADQQAVPAPPVTHTSVALEKTDVYVPNPQLPDERMLTKRNQTVRDDKGELTLQQIQSVKQTHSIGPIDMTIEEVKVIQTRPSYAMIDFFHGFTHEEAFDMVKIRVTVTNTSKQPVTFNPVAHVKINQSTEKTIDDDLYLEALAGTYEPSEQRSGNLGFITERPVEKLEFLTSDVLDAQQQVIKKGQPFTVTLHD